MAEPLTRRSTDNPVERGASAAPSILVGRQAPSPRARTLLDALVDAAAVRAPYLVLHVEAEPRRADAAEVLADARRWARTLHEAGARRGDAVAILLPTSLDFVGAFFGTLWLGAIPMPLASPMTFGPLDRYLDHLALSIHHAGATVLVTTPRVRQAARGSTLGGGLRALLTPADAQHVAADMPEPTGVTAREPALLQYTSGTTGRPRGVLLTHGAIVANTTAIAAALDARSDDVGVSWLPLYHDMGLIGGLLSALVRGYPLHMFSPEGFVMRPRRWLELLSAQRGTLSSAPNFAYDLAVRRIDPEGLDLSSWRAALNGAEPVHAATLARFSQKFGAYGLAPHAQMPVYGLAEATLAVSFHPAGGPVRTLEIARESAAIGTSIVPTIGGRTVVSVGRPVPGMSVSIRDERGRVLPESTLGEVRVRGPSLMCGYYRDEEASAHALEEGWLRTGDLGFVRDGRLFITGRARDLIIQAGRNVHAEDVERVALEAHGALLGAAAFARVDASAGTEDLVVVVEARGLDAQGKAAASAAIRGELLSVMGVRAAQVDVWPVGGIPRTSSGKVRRSACASRWETGGPS